MKFNLNVLVVVLIFAAGAAYFYVSLSSPVIFGDEGFHASVARATAQTGIIPKFHPTAQTDISHMKFADKPAFLLQETFAWMLFGEFGLKILFPIFSVLAAFMLFIFARKLKTPMAGLAAAFMLLAAPSLVTYGVMGYVDTMLVLFTICAVYFGYLAFKGSNFVHTALSGIFVGMIFLTKISAPFIIIFFLAFWLFVQKGRGFKTLLTVFVIAAVIIAPWLARNMLLFGNVCYGSYLTGPECGNQIDKPIEDLGIEFAGRTAEAGTETSLLRFGALNYVNFAYGWAITLIMFFGIAALVYRREEGDKLIAVMALSILPLFFFSTWRAEDTARYMLPLLVPISLIGGTFISDVFDWLKKYGTWVGAIMIIIFLITTWFYGQEKLNTMAQVKQFIPGFFDGCKWVDNNTPKDSIIFSTYTHHVGYACNRRTAGGIPDAPEIMLSYNDTAYNHMKAHGFDYIFVIQGLISQQEYSENYPVKFVQYIESSPNYKLVYDNTKVYGQAGVKIYQVL